MNHDAVAMGLKRVFDGTPTDGPSTSASSAYEDSTAPTSAIQTPSATTPPAAPTAAPVVARAVADPTHNTKRLKLGAHAPGASATSSASVRAELQKRSDTFLRCVHSPRAHQGCSAHAC